MFSNLVRIELIRLFHNKALRFCALGGILVIVIFLVFLEFMVDFGLVNAFEMRNLAVTETDFRYAMLMMSYSFFMTAALPVVVIFTTCEYQTYRLAVNIEGAVRSRLKLCLSEITGIFIFTALVNLLLFPCILLTLSDDPSGIIPFFIDKSNPLIVYGIITLSNFFSCLIVYLVSKFTSKVSLSFAISLLLGIVGIGSATFFAGFISGYTQRGGSLARYADDLSMIQFVAVPLLVLSVALAIKYRKGDRI